MKATRKLIPALALLVVSVMILSTASYAWFSMNKTVSATDMTVTVKSNATYLLIADTDTNGAATTNLTATVKAAADDGNAATVYPVYYSDKAGTMPGTADVGASIAVEASKWYTANNKNSNNAKDATKNVRVVDATNLADYTRKYSAWLTVSEDSESYTGKIKLTSVVTSGDAGTSVVVELGSGANTETIKLTNDTQATSTKDYTITSTTNVPVVVYVYVDGTADNVNSDYINTPNTLTGAASITFDLV